jgi:hypothetical protein
MSKIHAKIGVVLVALTAGVVVISAATASPASVNDGFGGLTIQNSYQSANVLLTSAPGAELGEGVLWAIPASVADADGRTFWFWD